MTTLRETSAVEGVGSREQGNTQTQGESHKSSRGATKGHKNKNKHTVNNHSKPKSRTDKQRRQHKYTDEAIAVRQNRSGQWRLCAGYNSKSFKKSCDLDRLRNKPSYKDLMNEVDGKNRYVLAQDGQEEADKRLEELKAFRGKQAVQNVTESKQWKRGGHGFVEDQTPDDMEKLILESYNNL